MNERIINISIMLACIMALVSCGPHQKGPPKPIDNISGGIVVEGDYLLDSRVDTNSTLYFSGSDEFGFRAKLRITSNAIELRRVNINTKEDVLLKRKEGKNEYPVDVRVLKNGNFFRIWVGNNTEWIQGPLGQWELVYEPFANHITFVDDDGSSVPVEITKRKWLEPNYNAAVKYGEDGSFYEQQVIPGAMLEYDGVYYMYFMAGMKGDEEGSSRRTIGMAKSSNLVDWEISPEPVVTYKDYPYDNLYINGVALTPDNKVALMFSAQDFPQWMGLMLAVSEKPEGPFMRFPKEPVYKHDNAAHEFDLIDMKEPILEYDGVKYRYMLFYAGFTGNTSSYKAGDKGFIIYSNDLSEWVYRKDNPVFFPETDDNWDSGHVRPRSLTRIGDWWYLWYEGCNFWVPPGGSTLWCDVIGLARSRNLVDWEYHPRNPVLSGLGIEDAVCGSSWVGWPRMVIKDQTAYVFFCGRHDNGKVSATFRTIPIDKMVDWETDLLN